MTRVLSSLRERSLETQISADQKQKIIALPSDLSKQGLGLEASVLDQVRAQTTLILHSAWAVNFNLGVESFEQQHIKGVYNLVNLSLSVPTVKPAQLFFCSSVSTAMATPAPATIPESVVEDFSHAKAMGYAQSKLVAEHIIRNAALSAGARGRVLRIGQIVGDRNIGLWNDTEAIPLMIRTANNLKALPSLNEVRYTLYMCFPANKGQEMCLAPR